MTTKKQTKQRTDCTPCIVCAVRLRLDSQQPTCRLTLRNLLPAHAVSMYINTQRPASQQPHPCQTSSPCALCMPQGPTTMHGTASPLSVCATCPRTAITRPGTQQAAIQIRSTMWSHSSCTRATHHFLQAPCLEQLLRYLCATIFQVSHCSLYDLLDFPLVHPQLQSVGTTSLPQPNKCLQVSSITPRPTAVYGNIALRPLCG